MGRAYLKAGRQLFVLVVLRPIRRKAVEGRQEAGMIEPGGTMIQFIVSAYRAFIVLGFVIAIALAAMLVSAGAYGYFLALGVVITALFATGLSAVLLSINDHLKAMAPKAMAPKGDLPRDEIIRRLQDMLDDPKTTSERRAWAEDRLSQFQQLR